MLKRALKRHGAGRSSRAIRAGLEAANAQTGIETRVVRMVSDGGTPPR